MFAVRNNTFETNSSSTHSFAISEEKYQYKELKRLFDEILYDIQFSYEEYEIVDILRKLNEAQAIILAGVEEEC